MALDDLLAAAAGNAALATLLLGLAALALRLGRSPSLAHGLCVLALAKLLTPPLLGLPLLPAAPAPGPLPELSAVEIQALAALPLPAEPVPRLDGLPWLLATWWLGSASILGIVLWRGRRFARLLRSARPADPTLRALAERLASRLGLRRVPALAVVDAEVSPALWAAFAPVRLVLPRPLLTRIGEDQRAALLLHELAHVRRRDHWVRWLELAALTLWWWLPPLWLLRRVLRASEEQCCDAWVVWALPGKERAYAEALLSTMDFLSGETVALPIQASGVGPVQHLKTRLTMIMDAKTHRRASRLGRLAVGAAALLLPILPTRAQGDDEAAGRLAEKHAAREEAMAKALHDAMARLADVEGLVKKLAEERAKHEQAVHDLMERLGRDEEHRAKLHELLLQAQAPGDKDHGIPTLLRVMAAQEAARKGDLLAAKKHSEAARKLAELQAIDADRHARAQEKAPEKEARATKIHVLQARIAGLQQELKALQAELKQLQRDDGGGDGPKGTAR